MTSLARGLAGAGLVASALAGCVSVPVEQRAFVALDGVVSVRSLPCGAALDTALPQRVAHGGTTLDPRRLRVVSWNLHKGADRGWQDDLARLAAEADLLLLQEAVLDAELRRVVDGSGHAWVLAGAFETTDGDAGVLAASRARPLAACTQRAFEPLFPLPKAALVVRYPLGDGGQTLAVANLHGVNFTLGLDAYRAQLDAVVAELATHAGPILLAGDLNTWSEARHAALHAAVAPLGLAAVELDADHRTRFVGQPVDHLFVRGLEVVASAAQPVRSSDHNPLLATLRVRGATP